MKEQVQMGGRRMKSEFQKYTPTATPGCMQDDCMGCKEGKGKGGKCQKGNINYEIEYK